MNDISLPKGGLLNDLESELEVLGAAMYDPDACEIAFEQLQPSHFGDAVSGAIFQCIVDLVRSGSSPQPPLVRDRVGAHPGFAAWGGFDLLFRLWNDAAPAAIANHVAAVAERAQRRGLMSLVDRLSPRIADMAVPLGDLVEELERGALEASLTASTGPELVSAADAADEVFAYLDSPEAEDGVLTGIEKLDEHTGMFLPGEMVMIAGRPGMMKSGFGDNVALNTARSGKGFIQVNMEMGRKSMTWRHLCNLAHERFGDRAPEYRDVKRKRLTPEQRGMLEAVRPHFSSLPLKMIKHFGLTLPGLRSLVRKQTILWQRQGVALGAVSVDHVGLLRSGLKVGRYEDQTALAIGLKALAGEINAPVFALVQLNREVEKRDNRRPQVFDLKDTGAWEENADVVIGLYREAYYAMKEVEPSENDLMKWQDWQRRRLSHDLDVILMKFREGEEATVTLWADPGRDAVRSYSPDLWGGR